MQPASSQALSDQSPAPAARGRRLQVRRSGVHGKGVFALRPLAAGELLIEYTGERITWDEALARHPHDPSQPDHTFYFALNDGSIVDGKYGGNASRYINHACEPNCDSEEDEQGRIWLRAARDIAAGEELFYNYGLTVDERYTPALKQRYACRCGAPSCTGTMLVPKPRKRGKRSAGSGAASSAPAASRP